MMNTLLLHSDPRMRAVRAALAIVVLALLALAVATGVADARDSEWYACQIDGKWMFCKDV